MKEIKKATLFLSGGFGMSKIECKISDYGLRKSTNGQDIAYVRYTPKRKRKEQTYANSSSPYVVILEGWNHSLKDEPFIIEKSGSGMITKKSKYSCFDSRYCTDFDDKLDAEIEKGTVEPIFMYRWTKNK